MGQTGLVLEGGGVRGIYTAGVLDAFMEAGLLPGSTFDGVIGVSAGAIHGCSYLSGQKGRSIRYYRKYVGDPRFMSWRSWLKTGDVVGAEFCYHTLPDRLDPYDHQAFRRCGVPFYAVCTDVETGRPAYIRLTDMQRQVDFMRAGASLPYLSRMVTLGGHKYLDGGCTDAIPLEAFRRMGYDRCVVILTRDAAYRKSPEMAAPARLVYRKYPAFAQALRTRHLMYNAQLEHVARLEREGAAFVIRPAEPLDVARLEKNPDRVQAAYDRGRADALAAMDALKRWLDAPQE